MASASVVLAVASSPATAAPAAPVASPPVAVAAHGRIEGTSRTVTLVTGERVHLSGAAGHERVDVERSDVRSVLEVHRLPGHLYVYPASLQPYVGRSLDLSLFDLEGRSAGDAGRVAVRITYTGQRPSVPGLHVTSARAGVAKGYVTKDSASDFGRSVRRAAAHPAAPGVLFAGISTVAAPHDDDPAPIHPSYPMFTVRISVTTAAGKPQALGGLFLLNVDDGARYAAFVTVEDGEARVSVPAGTYSLISDDYTEGTDGKVTSLTMATVNEYVVTGAGQTLAVDHRTATAQPSVCTPRPAESKGLVFDWGRVDAAESYSIDTFYLVDPGVDFRFAPSAPAKVGTLAVTQSWALEQAGTTPTYSYSLATLDDHLPADPRHVFTTAELATIDASYYGDGSGVRGGWNHGAEFDQSSGGGGLVLPVLRGTRRTEYVGATAPAQWSDLMLVNIDADEDPGFFESSTRPLPAGSTSTATWFRGALGAGFPVQPGGGFCVACRSGSVLSTILVPVIDDDPTHYGDLVGSGDELPFSRFRLTRGSRVLADEDDTTGVAVRVRAKKGTYRAVVDVDRRATETRLSTRSRTELTFASAKGQGQKLDDDDWFCVGSGTCRALPVLQARADLPVDLQDQLPLGRSTVTVHADQVQGAKRSAVTSATFEYRPAGYDWQSVELHPTAEGDWTGVIDTTEDAGTVADLRVGATDAAGSTVLQTVSRAFSVAAK